jgi:hypothetical protein
LNIAKTLCTAAVLLCTTWALAQAPASTSGQSAAVPANQTAKKGPQPKTQAEYEAFKTAASQTDAAKAEASATDFAQKFPNSELRPLLFQQSMGLYQAANNSDKALEMARATLKYDPHNPVALLTAADMLAERTHESDLDRDDRLAEATANARNALQYSGDLPQPANMTPEQFAGALAQLRGTAHEIIATVAFKKLDYFTAIKEYNAAIAEEKENADAVVWLRLSVAHDKSDDYVAALVAAKKAIAASEPNSQIRQLAEQEKSRLEKLSATPAPPVSK